MILIKHSNLHNMYHSFSFVHIIVTIVNIKIGIHKYYLSNYLRSAHILIGILRYN